MAQRLLMYRIMITPKLNRLKTPYTVVDELSQRMDVDQAQAWQALKGRITELRRQLQQTPPCLIGDSHWAEQIRELAECQKKLELLKPPANLRPPESQI